MGYVNTGSTACVSVGGTMISTVVSYSISRTNQTPGSGVTSKSNQGTKNVNGPRTWRASCVARSMPSGLGPGQSGEFRGCQGDSGVIQTGNVLCVGMSTTIDLKNYAPIEWRYEYQGTGSMTESVGTMIDTSPPQTITARGASYTVNGSTGNWNLAQVNINLTCAAAGGSATSKSNQNCRYCRGETGGTLSLLFENDRLSDIGINCGDTLSFSITLSNAQTLSLSGMKVTGFGEVTLDNSSPEPVTIQVEAVLSCWGGGLL